MKLKISMIIILGIISVLSLVGCVFTTIDEAMAVIPVQDAPYVITYNNDGWLQGAILAQGYEIIQDYIVVEGYYDKRGFHEGAKYIPLEWLIAIEQR